jgi:hypothetical protein
VALAKPDENGSPMMIPSAHTDSGMYPEESFHLVRVGLAGRGDEPGGEQLIMKRLRSSNWDRPVDGRRSPLLAMSQRPR